MTTEYIHCTDCGQKLSASTKFCSECGNNLNKQLERPIILGDDCQNCGYEPLASHKFCKRCGNALISNH